MAGDQAILAKIEFSILRYRNGKGSFASLVSSLDGCTLRVAADAPFRYELRSRWQDLDDINRASCGGARPEPQGEHRRQAEMVLDELLDLTRAHR